MEIMEHKYSRQQFDTYRIRVKVEITTITDDFHSGIDVYTTCEDREEIEKYIRSKQGKDVKDIKFVHYATREQDDLATEFIESLEF